MRKILYIAIVVFFHCHILSAEVDTTHKFTIENHSIHFPYHVGDWKYKHALGTSFIYLPKEWLETASSLPMIYYKSNFHLVKGFALHAEIKTLLAANDLSAGASYSFPIGSRLHAGIGYNFAYCLGMLYDLGYDNTLRVTAHRPYFKLGYRFEGFTLTLRSGIDYSNRIYFEAGGTNLSTSLEFLNGYNISLYLEQRMFRQKSFSMGFTNNLLKFHILGWPAFNYTKRMYYIPEFTALFNF